ncbi:MAG TPA: hypothetical protein VGT99_05830 [Gammaproteobacteria bacterium]|nr:hypothetical protein [Gammaproteobacteria bacterium]
MDIEEAQKLLARSVAKRRQWRADAREDFAFTAGHQWSEEDAAHMDEALRPRTTFNTIAPVADAIAGHEVCNRQEVSYIPRQLGASGVSEVLTAAAEWVREECDAEHEESEAFYDATVCGEGWTATELDYDLDLDGRIEITRVDPLEMDVDPSATRKNHADAKWVCRSKVYGRKEAQALWPDGEFASADGSREADSPVDVIAAAFYRADSGAGGRGTKVDTVIIHDFQWWEHEPVYRVPVQQLGPERTFLMLNTPDENGGFLLPAHKLQPDAQGLITLDAEEYGRVKTLLEGVQLLKQKRRRYQRMYFSGDELLETKPTPTGDSFTYKAITAKRDRKLRCWYGIVRAMKDPQRWTNKFMSSMLEIVGTSGKGGILYEPDAFLNVRQAEEDWADPSRNVAMTEGAIAANKILPRPVNQMPPQMMGLMEYCSQSIQAVAGVNPEVMGLSQALDPSGVMEEGRRQSGLNMLAYLFDGLRRYRKEQGRLILQMIRKYLPQGRLIRMTGPAGAQYLPLVYDDTAVEYDVIVDEAPTAPNVKQRTWEAFTLLAGQLPQLITPQVALIALDYSPFPQAMVQKLKQQAQAPAGVPSPDPMQQAEIANLNASTMLKGAQAEKARVQTQTNQF